MTEKNLVHH